MTEPVPQALHDEVVDVLNRVGALLVGYSPKTEDGPPKPGDGGWLLGRTRQVAQKLTLGKLYPPNPTLEGLALNLRYGAQQARALRLPFIAGELEDMAKAIDHG